MNYLRQEKLWGNDDPLFPATRVAVGVERRFRVVGIERKHWSSATAIRKIFREAFQTAGLPYFNPHSLRNTLVQLGETVCKTPEEFKAWSQNLGHEQVLTTFCSYGQVASARQAEIMRDVAKPKRDGASRRCGICESCSPGVGSAEARRNQKNYEQGRWCGGNFGGSRVISLL